MFRVWSEFMRPAKKQESASHNQEKKAAHRRSPTEKPCARLSEDVKIITMHVKDLTGKDGCNG